MLKYIFSLRMLFFFIWRVGTALVKSAFHKEVNYSQMQSVIDMRLYVYA